MSYAAGKITVIQLLERYISIKQGVRYNTKVGYNFVLNLVKKEDFGYRSIRDIKVSDAQKWIMKLHEDGKGYSTSPAFGALSNRLSRWRTMRM